jgi:3-deoxy-D-manno-octulosonic acid kinase
VKLPRGYTALNAEGTDAFAWVAAAGWADSVLASGHTLYDWASKANGVETFEGRGTVYSVPAPAPGPDRRERWAVRHYQRGGMMATVLDDRYVASGASRPDQELVASAEARTRGIPTPAVIAGAMYSAGVFYRADLITELVPNAVSLADLVFSDPGADSAPSGDDARSVHNALSATGQLVRMLEESRVVHADLNAMNVLFERETGDVHVIDLDRAAVLPMEGPAMDGGMRARLERSLHKLGEASGRYLSEGEWDALRAAWAEAS